MEKLEIETFIFQKGNYLQDSNDEKGKLMDFN